MIMKTYQILVVDDNEVHLRLISKMLTMEGYHVLTSQNTIEAIEAIVSKQPDLIILDVRMPGMNGYDFCKILRKPPYEVQVPIVMLTAVRGEDERVLAKEAGANGVWSKPFDIDIVAADIAKFLQST
jgi:CheY-like chemotaxis protein